MSDRPIPIIAFSMIFAYPITDCRLPMI